MTDNQSYEQRVLRLCEVRRKDSAAKRAAVLAALTELKREDRRISRRAVIARAGVHRNFLQRHKDLAALIDTAASDPDPTRCPRPTDRITADSLRTELATVKHRNRELTNRVASLEHRLSAHGATVGPAQIDHHPAVVELGRKLGQLEAELIDKNNTICSLQDDIDVLRQTNRSLVREYGLTDS